MSRDDDQRFGPERFFNLSRDMLCIAGTDGFFKLVNPAFETTLGWSMAELRSRPFYDFVHPDDLEATQNEVAKLARGIPTISFENRYRCSDGSYKLLLWTSQPEPETGLLYAVAHDISEQKRIEEELLAAKEAAEEAGRAKSAFLAMMSHEIRSPMNGILGMADLVLERTIDPDLRPHLEVVRESAEALLRLLDDLLDFSKIEAGRVELQASGLSLREALHGAVNVLAVQAHRKGLELLLRVAPDVPDALVGDAGRLRQIVVNLIGNAIRFTELGEVSLEVARENGSGPDVALHFAVRDTGAGIPKELQAHVFDRYWQMRAKSGAAGGTGLGLAISAQLVELMGGRIWVESEVEKGSTFHFTARFATSGDESEPKMPQQLAGRRLLLVDDNAGARRHLRELLEQWGLVVVEAASDAAALARLEEMSGEDDEPDLCLVDGHLPSVRAGLGLVDRLRQRLGGTPLVVMLDSVRKKRHVQRCRELGVQELVSKPIGEAALRRALLRATGLCPIVAAAATSGGPSEMRSLHVLVAEDSEVNQQVAVGLLEERGHTVDLVVNGREAVEAASAGSYDLVLMDLEMPVMNGLDATRAIRAAEGAAGEEPVAVIALTAHALPADRERCLDAGMTGYLAKPIRARELYSTLTSVAARSAVPPAPAAGTGESLVDWEYARNATGDCQELLHNLVAAAVEEVPLLYRQAHEALGQGDAETLRRCAHTLKGSIRYFGAATIVDELHRVEVLAAAADLESAAEGLDAIHGEIEALVSELVGSARDGG